MGTFRKQSQGKVLSAHARGPTPTASRGKDLGGICNGGGQGARCDTASVAGEDRMTPTPLWRRYARLFGPDPAADVKDELRFHLEAKIDDLVREGWGPEAARQEAERRFGDFCAVQQIGQRLGEKMEHRKRLTDYW